MFIADVATDFISFRGIPLYTKENQVVFVSELPFYVDNIVQNASLISIRKEDIKRYTPISTIHMLEKYSILHILSDDEIKLWKETLKKMFKSRSESIQSFLNSFSVKELLIVIDLWEAGDIIIESDEIIHHHPLLGLVSLDPLSKADCSQFKELITRLLKETQNRKEDNDKTLSLLKRRMS